MQYVYTYDSLSTRSRLFDDDDDYLGHSINT